MMKDADGKILYIGKAKSLRNRVRSYFQESATHTPRIAHMVERVRSIGFMVTATEVEALVLEDNFVKKHQPRYNVMLKDDKNYPYIKITLDEAFPRIFMVRRVDNDKGMYFGPYVSGKAVRSTLRLIHRIFPLRQSTDILDGKPLRRPCLNYQMKRCLAPCAGLVDREEYMELVNEVAMFLKGNNAGLLDALEKGMLAAAEKEYFETAARYRDQIAAIKTLAEKQKITSPDLGNLDALGIYEEAGKAMIKIFQVRRGKLNGERHFIFDKVDRADRAEALGAFIRQFYAEGMEIPPEILTPEPPDGVEALEERLTAVRGGKTRIYTPVKGRKRQILNMAERNAKMNLGAIMNTSKSRGEALEEIRATLGLPSAPMTMEAYDISNTSGLSAVGSMIVFKDGAPSKDDYRKYKIKSVTGPNDYASMAEVIMRRFSKLAETGEPFADLLIIDGGKGQVNAVMEAFRSMNITPPPVVGIAKGADRENPESDEFILPGRAEPAPFPPTSPGRFLLQQARDEAHRFAVAYHRQTRDAAARESSLDNVPGIGPRRKKLLLTKFGSVKRAREAALEDLMETLKVSETVARRIRENL